METNSEKDHETESLVKGIQSKDGATTQEWRARRDAAIRHYHELGLCPIPLRGKAPYQKGWQNPQKYQGVTADEVLMLFQPNDNVGLLAGIPLKDGQYLRIIDYDDDYLWKQHIEQALQGKGYEWLEPSGIVFTGSGGKHHYVLSDAPEKFVFQGHNGNEHGGEVQGARTQCVAPPSIHPDTGREYLWQYESWDRLPFVTNEQLQHSYTPVKEKAKFEGGRKKEEKQGFSSSDPRDFGNDSPFYDYSTIDFIALFQSRGWVIEDKVDAVIVLCPNRGQHTNNTDGTSTSVILRTNTGGQRFKCLHGHCEHLSDRDELVKLLGGDDVLKGYAKERQAGSSYIIREADPDLQRRMDEEFQNKFPSELPPLPTVEPPPPKLKVNLLPEPLASFCEVVAVENETTPEAVAGFLLTALGTVTGTRILIAPDLERKPTWFESSIRSTALVMPVSSNKTAVYRAGLLPLERLQKRYDHEYKLALKEHAQKNQPLIAQRKGLLRKLEKTELKPKERLETINLLNSLEVEKGPAQTVLVMSRATPEKLIQIASLGDDRGFLMKSDELVGLIEQTTRAGNEGLREFYIEAMTVARNFSGHTIGRGSEFVNTLALSLAGCVQPSKLKRLLRDLETGFKDDGLLQRFIWIWPDQPSFSEFEKAAQTFGASRSTLQREVQELFEILDLITPGEVGAIETEHSPAPFCHFDKEAQGIWREWRKFLRESIILDEEISDGYKSWLMKSERLVSGLALSFHCVECATLRRTPGLVTPDELNRAIDCWDGLRHHASRVFLLTTTTAVESVNELAKKLPLLAPEFTLRDLKRKCWAGLRDDRSVLEALEWLCDLGYLQEIVTVRPNRGRPPSPRFLVNPNALRYQ